MKKITNISSQKIISQLLRYGTQIIFVAAIVVMIYLSFVEDIGLDLNTRKLTTIALIGIILNWTVWNTYYRKNYEMLMQQDVKNADNDKYCIHRRYYFARRGWKEDELRSAIRSYNNLFVKSWIHDVEDLCARTEKDIVEGPYKGNDHWLLIWRLKHHKYPKSGIRGPKDILRLLNVSSIDSMRFKPREAENYALIGNVRKLITSILAVGLTAAITVEFVQGNWASAIITLLLNVVILFASLFFGSIAGQKGAKIKLATVEEACEKLEEWHDMKPVEEPYKEEPKALVEERKRRRAELSLDTDDDVPEPPNKPVIELV